MPALRRPHAFTLIELLVVIAVILILAALASPLIGSSIRQAKGVKCCSNLKQIGTALMSYLKDSKMRFPLYQPDSGEDDWAQRRDWTSLTLPYVPNREIYKCPARKRLYIGGDLKRGIQFPINYGMNYGVHGRIYTRIENPSRIGVIADADHDRFYTRDKPDPGWEWGMIQVRKERVHGGETAGLLFADWHAQLVKDVSKDMFLPH
jgi:prepilin-type N-terminal cleavage/methylation domain-containing protein